MSLLKESQATEQTLLEELRVLRRKQRGSGADVRTQPELTVGQKVSSMIGSIKGTYGYMAPEQVRGELVTPRADVYAAAVVLWELLTKRRAFLRGALPELEVIRALADPHIVPLDVCGPISTRVSARR